MAGSCRFDNKCPVEPSIRARSMNAVPRLYVRRTPGSNSSARHRDRCGTFQRSLSVCDCKHYSPPQIPARLALRDRRRLRHSPQIALARFNGFSSSWIAADMRHERLRCNRAFFAKSLGSTLWSHVQPFGTIIDRQWLCRFHPVSVFVQMQVQFRRTTGSQVQTNRTIIFR